MIGNNLFRTESYITRYEIDLSSLKTVLKNATTLSDLYLAESALCVAENENYNKHPREAKRYWNMSFGYVEKYLKKSQIDKEAAVLFTKCGKIARMLTLKEKVVACALHILDFLGPKKDVDTLLQYNTMFSWIETILDMERNPLFEVKGKDDDEKGVLTMTLRSVTNSLSESSNEPGGLNPEKKRNRQSSTGQLADNSVKVLAYRHLLYSFLYHFGKILITQHKTKAAETCFENGLAVMRKMPKVKELDKAHFYRLTADGFSEIGKYKRAYDVYRQSLQIYCKEYPDLNDRGIVEVLHGIANALYSLKKYDRALYFTDLSLRLWFKVDRKNDPIHILKTLDKIVIQLPQGQRFELFLKQSMMKIHPYQIMEGIRQGLKQMRAKASQLPDTHQVYIQHSINIEVDHFKKNESNIKVDFYTDLSKLFVANEKKDESNIDKIFNSIQKADKQEEIDQERLTGMLMAMVEIRKQNQGLRGLVNRFTASKTPSLTVPVIRKRRKSTGAPSPEEFTIRPRRRSFFRPREESEDKKT